MFHTHFKLTVSDFRMLYCMRQIYGMETLIDTARPPTVWDSLTPAQLSKTPVL